MSISSPKHAMAGKMAFAGLFLSVVMTAALSGSALAANVGDEIPFKEGDAMPRAPSGMSWCLIHKPAVFDTETDTVVVREKATFQVPVPGEYSTRPETVVTVPAHRVGNAVPVRMETKTMTYVMQEGYEILEVIPPEFADSTKEVEVCPAYERITVIPAVFRDSSRRIMTSPARKRFERDECGEGNLCWTVCETPEQFTDVPVKELVSDAREERTPVPAKTKMVPVRTMVKPAEIRRIAVPPSNNTYTAAFVATPPRVDWRNIPVETRDVPVEVETRAPSLATKSLPEKTETVSRRVLVQREQLVWRLQNRSDYSADKSCYRNGEPCDVARHLPQEIPHECSK